MAGELTARDIERLTDKVDKLDNKLDDKLDDIGKSLRTLVLVEERHAVTSRQVTSLEERFRIIENKMPLLDETRKWVVGAIISIVGIVGMAVFNLALRGTTL